MSLNELYAIYLYVATLVQLKLTMGKYCEDLVIDQYIFKLNW